MNKAIVEKIDDCIYDGNVKTPQPVVKYKADAFSDAVLLTEKKDYILSYGENTNAGTGTVTITQFLEVNMKEVRL